MGDDAGAGGGVGGVVHRGPSPLPLRPLPPRAGLAQPPPGAVRVLPPPQPSEGSPARPGPAASGGQQQAALLPLRRRVPAGAASPGRILPARSTHLRRPAVLVEVQVGVPAQDQLSPPALAVAHHWEGEGP